MRAGIESSLYNFGEQVLIEDFNGLPGKPHHALLHQFPGAAVKGLMGHAQEGRQLFTRDGEGNRPGILHFGQEQNVAGDSRLGGLEGQVGQAAPEPNHQEGQKANPFSGEFQICGYQVQESLLFERWSSRSQPLIGTAHFALRSLIRESALSAIIIRGIV